MIGKVSVTIVVGVVPLPPDSKKIAATPPAAIGIERSQGLKPLGMAIFPKSKTSAPTQLSEQTTPAPNGTILPSARRTNSGVCSLLTDWVEGLS